MKRVMRVRAAAAGVLVFTAACAAPRVDGLRDSFVRQLAANTSVKDLQRNADELTFTGPGADRTVIRWRVHIDSAEIAATTDAQKPYKGTVKSSWYAGDYKVVPEGDDSNLPIELISNGLAQDCWAAWNRTTKTWEWE